MSRPWLRFLFLHFVLWAIALTVIAQALAFLLSAVPLRRDRTDELALAVRSDPTNYRILLFGDSITRNATARYSLGPPGEVANLAAHAHFGWPGEFLLLRRYLRAHSAPQHIVLAFAPGMYNWVSNTRLIRYQLWNTFTDPDEREFLKAFLPDIDQRDWMPAIANLQERIVEPLFSLVKQKYLDLKKAGPPRIAAGALIPDANAAVDKAPHHTSEWDEGTDAESLTPAPVNAASLRQMCLLSKQYGFRVHIVWPPMAEEIEQRLIDRGALDGLVERIRVLIQDDCNFDGIFDFNAKRRYSIASFHLDLIHLFGDGWEQRYASDLRAYLDALTDRSFPAEATRPPQQASSP